MSCGRSSAQRAETTRTPRRDAPGERQGRPPAGHTRPRPTSPRARQDSTLRPSAEKAAGVPAENSAPAASGRTGASRPRESQLQPPLGPRRPWHAQTTGTSPSGPGSRIQRCPQQSGQAASYAAFGVGVVQAPVAVPPGRQPMGIQNIDHLHHQPPPRRGGTGAGLAVFLDLRPAHVLSFPARVPLPATVWGIAEAVHLGCLGPGGEPLFASVRSPKPMKRSVAVTLIYRSLGTSEEKRA